MGVLWVSLSRHAAVGTVGIVLSRRLRRLNDMTLGSIKLYIESFNSTSTACSMTYVAAAPVRQIHLTLVIVWTLAAFSAPLLKVVGEPVRSDMSFTKKTCWSGASYPHHICASMLPTDAAVLPSVTLGSIKLYIGSFNSTSTACPYSV